MQPVLIATCGVPFSGKSTLAKSLSHALDIRVLSYDFEVYLVHRHLVPTGSSVTAEYDFVQDIGRREVGAILTAGESLIYDDLLLDRDDRGKLAAVARASRARLVFVYLDTPLAVINQRRAENSRSRSRTSIPDAKMELDIAHLEPPGPRERAVYVRPGDALPDVVAKIKARFPRGGQPP